jgi:hypothetical protein
MRLRCMWRYLFVDGFGRSKGCFWRSHRDGHCRCQHVKDLQPISEFLGMLQRRRRMRSNFDGPLVTEPSLDARHYMANDVISRN